MEGKLKKENLMEEQMDDHEEKPQETASYPPFHESAFVKVYLSFVILNAALVLVAKFWLQPEVAGGPQFDPVSLLLMIIGLTTFVMSIVAWLRFRRAGYLHVALVVPISRILVPMAVNITAAVWGGLFFARNADLLNSETPPTAEEIQALVPAGVSYLEWVSVALMVFLIGWSIYLFTVRED